MTPKSFRDEYPLQLVRLQEVHWLPLVEWARTEFNVRFDAFDSILKPTQPEATRKALLSVLNNMDAWSLAGETRW
jgi:ATP synthase F1 complex assembly factor 2